MAEAEDVEVEIRLPLYDGQDTGDTDDSLSDSDVDHDDDPDDHLSYDDYPDDDYSEVVKVPKRAYEISCAIEEKEAPFSCGGWAPLCAPLWLLRGEAQNPELLQLPLPEASSTDAIAKFVSHCTRTQGKFKSILKLKPAVDLTSCAADGAPGYALLSSKDFVTDFHPLHFGIIEKVQQVLKPEMKLVPKLDKLSIYGAGDSSKPQNDGSDGNLVASLVVVLPSTYTGGELVASRGGEEHVLAYSNMSSDPSKIRWLCYSSDCELEVKEVKSGFLVTLEYNLYSGEPTEAVVDSFPPTLGRMLNEAMESREFFEKGALLGFPCQHLYSATVKSPRGMVPLLKGSDAELYHSARAAGLKVQVRPVWEGYYVGREFHGLKVDIDGNYIDEGLFEKILENYDRKRILWCHDKGHWKDGFATFHFDHKRGSVSYIKCMIAILVKVPPWEERASNKRIKLSP